MTFEFGAVIQARTSSTRLPKKTLLKIEGQPVIWHIFKRLKYSKKINILVLATTNLPQDQELIEIAKKENVATFTGSLEDVLARVYQAACRYKIKNIVRLTGDNPLVDPFLIDDMISEFTREPVDYLSNTIKPTYPDGLDVEIFTFQALAKAYQEAKLKSEREHVTSYILKNKVKFKLKNYSFTENLANWRLTLDEPADLKLIRQVFKKLSAPNQIFTLTAIINYLKSEPKLLEINQHIQRNEGYLKSLKEDELI